MARKVLVPVDRDDLISLHSAHLGSVNALAKHFGVSRCVVSRWLDEYEIRPWPLSETLLAISARRSPERRREIVAAANAAARGRKATGEQLRRAALGREANPRMSRGEVFLLRHLERCGIGVTPQKAIGPYNCDLAFGSVAVEVHGGNWHAHGYHRLAHDKRSRYILDAGLHLLIVWDQVRAPISSEAGDYVVSFAEFADRNPTIERQYRVIRGSGDEIARGQADDDHLPLVMSQRYANGRGAGDGGP